MVKIYNDTPPAELPRYTYREAARATGIPAATIRAWFRGTTYSIPAGVGQFEAVLTRPEADDPRLSFYNLLEVNTLRALRQVHNVRMDKVRTAIVTAQEIHGIDRLLISSQLRTSGGRLFLDSYFELVELSRSAQLAMRTFLQQYLNRISLEEIKFYPLPKLPGSADERPVVVSPLISFGNPIIQRVGVSTAAIAERVNVGEERDVIIADYKLEGAEFEEAILYESAA